MSHLKVFTDNSFTDQVVIVTGGTRGIGAAITEAFLSKGAKVLATYNSNHQAAQSFKEKMLENYTDCTDDHLQLFSFNVAKAHEVENFFKNLDEKSLTPTVLVNNSGIRKDSLLATLKEEDWDQVIDINLKGTYLMSKHVVLRFLRKRYGRIVNMSSIGGILGLSGQGNYSASKAGQIALAKSLSKEVAKKGITVNNVAPGFIETELIQDLPKELVSEYKKQVPMRRFGSTDEVAAAVLFLASPAASYITGATVEISGGLS